MAKFKLTRKELREVIYLEGIIGEVISEKKERAWEVKLLKDQENGFYSCVIIFQLSEDSQTDFSQAKVLKVGFVQSWLLSELEFFTVEKMISSIRQATDELSARQN